MQKELIREKVTLLLKEMSRGALEREEVISLSLLAALGGESIFLLGLPGVGKSMVARRLKTAFRDANCFEYLMSRFSTPDDIFGPVSISKLKDTDTYERVVDGYLPTADIVFLDEIWKAGPAIQNSLLTAINEKIFHNGNRDLNLPAKGIIAASNELPAEGEGLEALWDRFLIRYVVEPIRNPSAFADLITGNVPDCNVPTALAFTAGEYEEIREMQDTIIIDGTIVSLLTSMRSEYIKLMSRQREDDDAETAGLSVPYVSDRRWKKIAGLLKMSALLNGRSRVDLSDCLLLEHLIWDRDDQRQMVCNDVAKNIIGVLSAGVGDSGGNVGEGTFYSPDGGLHYVFDTGNDQYRILASDFRQLDGTGRNGRFVPGGVALVEGSGDFLIRTIKPGTVTINSFTYPLRINRSTSSRIKDGENSVSENVELFRRSVNENIFTRGGNDYPALNTLLRLMKRSSMRKR